MKGEAQWSELFAKHDFFMRYRYYIQVVASAGSAEGLKKWCAVKSMPLLVTRYMAQSTLFDCSNRAPHLLVSFS